ncbi:MAG: CPBP family intramembrane metalloprotease [Deltaproteobacteria bacterium]|nr:CPBP family intramembrane metalloprotease [Deltaproteobacteria bacterium]
MKSRVVALLLLLFGPAVAFRLHGLAFWGVYGGCCLMAAGLSAWELEQDGVLRETFKRKGFDLLVGMTAAAALYAAVYLLFTRWIAPTHIAGGLLTRCSLDGPLLPRLEAHGQERVAEWFRVQICKGYANTLSIHGSGRGVVVLLVAVLEEIGWRGGAQQLLAERLGSTRGWIAASLLCGLAHALTPTPALGGLALVCALVWGAMVRYRGRLIPAVFSHAVFSFYLFHQLPLVRF